MPIAAFPDVLGFTRFAGSRGTVWRMPEVNREELPEDGAVWRAEGVAICAALGVLLLAFCA